MQSLQRLLEQASRRVALNVSDSEQIVRLQPGCHLLRRERAGTIEASLYEPVLCLILYGRKQVSIAGQVLSFGPGECLLVSHDLHVNSRITKAPYLSLVFALDVAVLRKLYDEIADAALDVERARAAEVHQADPALLDALGRYLALPDAAAGAAHAPDARVLGPLISKEIHYRLLAAPFGGMLRSLIRYDSTASAVARAIGHMRGAIGSPLGIPELARRVGMSVSAFHKHFKSVTAATPLQYQKDLRLLEARRLLRAGASVTSVAYDVGYESASQFSREYARKYGMPPRDDRT